MHGLNSKVRDNNEEYKNGIDSFNFVLYFASIIEKSWSFVGQGISEVRVSILQFISTFFLIDNSDITAAQHQVLYILFYLLLLSLFIV